MEKNNPPKKPYSQMTDEEIVEYVKNKYSNSSNNSLLQPKLQEPLKPFASDEERIQSKREILQELQALNDLAAREEGTASGRTSTPIKGIQRTSEQAMDEDLKLWGMDSPLAKAAAKVIMGTGNVMNTVPALAAIATKNVISGDEYDATERLKALGKSFVDPTLIDNPTGFGSEVADPSSREGQLAALAADIAVGGFLSPGTLARAGKALSTVGRTGVTAAKAVPKAAVKAGETAVKAGQAAVKAKDVIKNLDVKASAKDFITKGKTYLEESKTIKSYKTSIKDELEVAKKQIDDIKTLEKKLGVLDEAQQKDFEKAKLALEEVSNKQKVTEKLSDRQLLDYINLKNQIQAIDDIPELNKLPSKDLEELFSKQKVLKDQVKSIEDVVLNPPKKQTLEDLVVSKKQVPSESNISTQLQDVNSPQQSFFNTSEAQKAKDFITKEADSTQQTLFDDLTVQYPKVEQPSIQSSLGETILEDFPKQAVLDPEAPIRSELPLKPTLVLDSENFTKPFLKNQQRSLKKTGVLGPDLPLEDAIKAAQDLIESGQAGFTPKLEAVIKRMQSIQEGRAGKDLSLKESVESIKNLRDQLKTMPPIPEEMELAKSLQKDFKALEKTQTSQVVPTITAAPVTPPKGPKAVLETPKTPALVSTKAKPRKTKQERKAEIKTVVEQKVKDLPPKEKIKTVKSMAVQDFFDRQDTVINALRKSFNSVLLDIDDVIKVKSAKLGLPKEQMDDLNKLLNTISRSVAGKQGYHASTQYNMLEKVADNVKLSPEARQALQSFIDANKQKEALEQISLGLKNAAIDMFERFNNQIKKENPLLEPFQDEIKTLMETMDGFSKQFDTVAKAVASKSPEVASKEVLLKQYPELGTVMTKAASNILKKQDQDVIAATEMGRGRYSSKITPASQETKKQLVGPKEEPSKKVDKKQEAKSTPKKEEKVENSLPAQKTESKPKQTITNKLKEPVKTAPKLSEAQKESISKQIVEIEEELATPGLKKTEELSLKKELESLKAKLKD